MSLSIPVIDFAPFMQGTDGDRAQVAHQVAHACRDVGFLYLQNHSVSPALIDATFAQAKRFFTLPLAAKQAVAWDALFHRLFCPTRL
jgi:isopenicillin N synthase-like dioxygenase